MTVRDFPEQAVADTLRRLRDARGQKNPSIRQAELRHAATHLCTRLSKSG